MICKKRSYNTTNILKKKRIRTKILKKKKPEKKN